MGTSSAPEPDPALGEAALLAATTGQDMLDWMMGQSAITTGWAKEDRARYESLFRPVEDQFVRDSTTYDTPERRAAEAAKAQASVRQQTAISRDAQNRSMAAMGVKPGSGRFGASGTTLANQEALAAVGAGNLAEKAVEAEGRARTAQAINLGQGLAVNPGTSMAMGTSAGATGFQGAQAGYATQGDLLNTQYNQQMAQYNANTDAMAGLMGGVGSVVGTGLSMGWFSSEKAKEDKRPTRGALRAVERMRVDDWTYKKGMGDGGRHTGPYAEEFHRETGRGDGTSIPVIDAVGVTMGAVKELAAKVDKLDRRVRGAVRPRERAAA